MTGPCSQCGKDPGFDWGMCPSCGFRPGAPGAASAQSNSDRWDPTIIERTSTGDRPRARFGGGGDFYQPVDGPAARPAQLRMDSGNDADRTILDRGFDRAGGAEALDDRTIIDRGGRGAEDDDDAQGDATVIVRDGRKGITGPLIYLVQRNGIRAGRIHLLTDEVTIGRSPDQDIILADDTVSKRHAKIRREDGRMMFWDLASANHSYFVNSEGGKTRILEPRALQDGDTLLLGEARVTYIEVDRGPAEE